MRVRSFDLRVSAQQTQQAIEEMHRIDNAFRRRLRMWLALLGVIWLISAAVVLSALSARPAYADELPPPELNVIIISPLQPIQPAPPFGARRWRAELTRAAYTTWGLDAPIAVFAAQVHQESVWRPEAVSHVGAVGLGQFMPGTSSWWCRIHSMTASQCQPRNPVWSLRALVGYDLWLWQQIGRMPGAAEMDQFSRVWATLRAYNGGLGNWQAEARAARSLDRLAVDAACGRGWRSYRHCRENVGYPYRILVELQPRYANWGPVLLMQSSGGAR